MAYGWEAHHTMNRIAQGKNTVENWDKLIIDDEKKYASDDILMNFVDNHDENSWNGTIQSRLGAAEEAMTALTYVMPGMPLVYSGNEYGLKHSLKFFEKDSIPKTKGKEWELRAKLGQLKNENMALHGGKNPATYKRISTNDDTKILAFEREKDGEKIIYIANLSNQTIETKIQLKGDFTDYMSGYKIQFRSDSPIGLKAWQYLILIPN
jgi:glycosidase